MSNPSKNTDVEEALDLLSEEVREEIQRIRKEGAGAMLKGDLATARSVIDFAEKLEHFAGNVDRLVEEWNSISDQQEAQPEPVRAIVSKIFPNKARKGTITTHEEFYVPLLQALVNLGGTAKTKDALDEVGRIMEGKLEPKDFDFLKSGTETIRWRNKVMWARSSLVNQLGLMKSDSAFGVWAISDKGREYLSRLSAQRSLPPVTAPSPPVVQLPAPQPVYIPDRPRFPSKLPESDVAVISTRPVPHFRAPGGTKEPQSNISIVIRRDIIGKGQPEPLRAATAAATLVQTILRLSKVLGPETLERLTRWRISRGPLLSRNPARDFMNKISMETYQNHLIPGTDLYVLTQTSTDEKVKQLKDMLTFLKLPSTLFEVKKHHKS
jgi:restriction system protein